MDATQTSIYTAVLITAFVIGALIVFFIISIIRQQRRNLALHRLNILAEITTLERERDRIAHDLHDELGPLLSAVKMKINSFELTDQDDKVQIIKTNEHIDDILKRMREISFDLMPSSLLRKGIVTALKEFTDFLNNGNNMRFYFTAANDVQVNEQKAINIYRIVQETVHNAIKHSGASEFRTEIKKDRSKIILSLADNGNGFDHRKESAETIGFGLRGLLSRSEMIGAQMYLESEKGKGTVYTFEIPDK